MTTRSAYRGFTLIELMVTVTIVAILAAIAVPSMTETLQRNAQESTIAELSNTLAFARSEAMSRGQLVSVCQSTDGVACSTSGDWSAGWLVFVDPIPPASGISAVVDANEQILRVHGAVKNGTIVKMREGLVANDLKTSIRFDRSGFLNSVGPSQAVFTVCRRDTVAAHAKGLMVNLAGRISYTRDSDANGTEDFPVGASIEDLSCN